MSKTYICTEKAYLVTEFGHLKIEEIEWYGSNVIFYTRFGKYASHYGDKGSPNAIYTYYENADKLVEVSFVDKNKVKKYPRESQIKEFLKRDV